MELLPSDCILTDKPLLAVGGVYGALTMKGVPKGIDAHEVGCALHNMHIWSLSSSSQALAAHVDVEAMGRWEEILPQMQTILRERFYIEHSTLQPEDAAIRQACDADPDCGARNLR